jgi:hypothetical protein
MKNQWLSGFWSQVAAKLNRRYFAWRRAERSIRRNRRRANRLPPTEPLESRMLLTAPAVVSINDVLASPTNQSTIPWTVTFNQVVAGVDPTDFVLVKTGTVGVSLLQITGSGSVYTITASGVTGNGTLGLNLVDNDSIWNFNGYLGGGRDREREFYRSGRNNRHDFPVSRLDNHAIEYHECNQP